MFLPWNDSRWGAIIFGIIMATGITCAIVSTWIERYKTRRWERFVDQDARDCVSASGKVRDNYLITLHHIKIAVILREKGGSMSDYEAMVIEKLINLSAVIITIPMSLGNKFYSGQGKIEVRDADFIIIGTSLTGRRGWNMSNKRQKIIGTRILTGDGALVIGAKEVAAYSDERLLFDMIEFIVSAVDRFESVEEPKT